MQPNRNSNRGLIIATILVGLLVAAGLAYAITHSSEPATPTDSAVAAVTSTPDPCALSDKPTDTVGSTEDRLGHTVVLYTSQTDANTCTYYGNGYTVTVAIQWASESTFQDAFDRAQQQGQQPQQLDLTFGSDGGLHATQAFQTDSPAAVTYQTTYTPWVTTGTTSTSTNQSILLVVTVTVANTPDRVSLDSWNVAAQTSWKF